MPRGGPQGAYRHASSEGLADRRRGAKTRDIVPVEPRNRNRKAVARTIESGPIPAVRCADNRVFKSYDDLVDH